MGSCSWVCLTSFVTSATREAARVVGASPSSSTPSPSPLQVAPSDDGIRLHWGPHCLQVAAATQVDPGPACQWAVLPQNVLLVRPDKPWGDRLENPVPATVDEVIELGAEVLVWLQPQGLPGAKLQMRLPTRAVRRYAVTAGAGVTVCLRPSDIVLLGSGPSAV